MPRCPPWWNTPAGPCCGTRAALRGFRLRLASVAGKGVQLGGLKFRLFWFYPLYPAPLPPAEGYSQSVGEKSGGCLWLSQRSPKASLGGIVRVVLRYPALGTDGRPLRAASTQVGGRPCARSEPLGATPGSSGGLPHELVFPQAIL